MVYHLWDWDDSLAYTRYALYLSYKEALSPYGIKFEFDYFNDFIYNDANKFLRNVNFTEDEIKEIKKQKEYYYLEKYFDKIEFKFPEFKNSNNVYFIVTNTNEEIVRKILIKKFGNTKPFKHIIGSYGEIRRKPFPDLYEYTFNSYIKNMWNSTKDSIEIYEDSIEGLLSAITFINNYRKRIINFKINHVKH